MTKRKFAVNVPLYAFIEVEAEDEQGARDQASEWIEWVFPTEEQLEDFKDDHEDNTSDVGAWGFNGVLEVEEVENMK